MITKDIDIYYLLGHTIKGKDALRNKFKELLENDGNLNVESINESMYKTHHTPDREMGSNVEKLCREAEKESGEKFVKGEDFVRLYHVERLYNIKCGGAKIEEIEIYPV